MEVKNKFCGRCRRTDVPIYYMAGTFRCAECIGKEWFVVEPSQKEERVDKSAKN